MENRKIGAFIAERRKANGLTQQALADRLGLTNKAVSKWETGDGLPDITVLPALAENLGVTVDELLAGERNPKTPGLETRKYLEDRKRKQYQIAVIVSAVVLVAALPYAGGGSVFWLSTPYLFLIALSVGGYLAANIWMPGQETLRLRKGFCALWMAMFWSLPMRWLLQLAENILDRLAEPLAERYVQSHALTAEQSYWDFLQYYESKLSRWTVEHTEIFLLASLAIMVVLGLLVGQLTWKLQHRKRKQYEPES